MSKSSNIDVTPSIDPKSTLPSADAVMSPHASSNAGNEPALPHVAVVPSVVKNLPA